MIIEKHTDNLKVLTSGCFLLKNSEANALLKIDLRPEISFACEVEYCFEKGNEGEDASISAKVENNRLIITCVNAENPFGNGMLSAPILATVGDKKIRHNFFISRPGEVSPRMFYYTIYVEE